MADDATASYRMDTMKKRMEAVEVFVNDDLYVMISDVHDVGAGAPNLVAVLPEQVDLLIEWLKEARDEALRHRKEAAVTRS